MQPQITHNRGREGAAVEECKRSNHRVHGQVQEPCEFRVIGRTDVTGQSGGYGADDEASGRQEAVADGGGVVLGQADDQGQQEEHDEAPQGQPLVLRQQVRAGAVVDVAADALHVVVTLILGVHLQNHECRRTQRRFR